MSKFNYSRKTESDASWMREKSAARTRRACESTRHRQPQSAFASSRLEQRQSQRILMFGPPVKLVQRALLVQCTGQANAPQAKQQQQQQLISTNTKIDKLQHNKPKSSKMLRGRSRLSFGQLTLGAAIVISALLNSLGNCDNSILGQEQRAAAAGQSHKEKLLSSLAEEVERQHLRAVSPIRSFVHRRPSKFDSESSSVITRLVGAVGGQSAKPAGKKGPTKTPEASSNQLDSFSRIYQAHDNQHRHHQQYTPSVSKGGTQDMQQRIEMMHEIAGSSSRKRPAQAAPEQDKTNNEAPSKWLTGLRQPIGANAQHVLALPYSNKMASVLSLLSTQKSDSDLRTTSLSPSSGKNDAAGTTSLSPATDKKTKASRAFSPRASSLAEAMMNKQLMGSLLGLGQMIMLGTHKTTDLVDTSASATLQEPVNVNLADKKYRPTGLVNNIRNQISLRSAPSASNSNSATAQVSHNLMVAESSSQNQAVTKSPTSSSSNNRANPTLGLWLRKGANQLAQSYFQDSLRDFLALSQLPILSGGPVSTAPSDLEPGGKLWLAQKAAAQQAKGNRTQTLEEFLRYAYIFGAGVRRKRDPLKVLGQAPSNTLMTTASNLIRRPARAFLKQRKTSNPSSVDDKNQAARPYAITLASLGSLMTKNRNAKPRGVMWDMATDPTLAVTVLHLLERASVALPLGFLLMPFVHMARTNPLHNIPIDLAKIIPARASHRSVDYEELAKRLDMMDKILSRALRPTHREAAFLG